MDLDPNWVAAIGQVAGAIATLIAVVVALQIAARDRRQREQDRLNEAVGRAAMVFIRDDGGTIVVTNHSDRPVRDVQIYVGHPSNPRLRWSPTNRAAAVADLLPAGAEVSQRATGSLVAPRASWLILKFVDIEGRHWVRSGDELPEWQRELTQPPARWRPWRRQPGDR